MVVQKNGELIIRAEQIIDEAYNRGKNDAKREISLSGEYERAYQRGLDDAWEASRKICELPKHGGLDWDDLEEAFGVKSMSRIFEENTANEAIEKIRKYEQDHAPGYDNCKHKDDQFSVCSGCEDGSEYETETTEANCGECHRRYYCEASPDSCIYSKIEQAESERKQGERPYYELEVEPGCYERRLKDKCLGCKNVREITENGTYLWCSYVEECRDFNMFKAAESEQVDDEIRVGDEVIYQRKSPDPHSGEKGVVIGISGNWREVRFLAGWSSVGVHEDSLIKTGRHFSQIEEVLKQMQEEQE